MKKIIPLFVAMLVPACVFAQSGKNKNEAMIKASRMASNEAIARQNVEDIASYWLPDFVQVRGNGSHLIGKDTIASLWRKTFKENPTVSYVRNPSEIIISSNDSLAWENGNWIGINSYSKGGKYSAMWRKRTGVWKLQAELFVALD